MVEQAQLTAPLDAAQSDLELQPLDGPEPHRPVEDLRTRLPEALGVVHRDVRVAHEVAGMLSLSVERDTDARGDEAPRAVDPILAGDLIKKIPHAILPVGLFVDPSDFLLNDAMNNLRLDYLQLHGKESAERVEEVRLEFGMPVIKAVQIASAADLEAAKIYDGVADILLFDAKAPAGADRPGGNGVSFDWSLLKASRWQSPWFLAGGLTPDNVEQAIAAAEPAIVARFAFQLAQEFNNFYHHHHILTEEDPARKTFLLATAAVTLRELVTVLSWLGIETPEAM